MVSPVEGQPLPEIFWTFDMVEEALVQAMLLWWRMPDRERGWLSVRAYWPDIRRHNHFGDYSDDEATPRPLPLTRAEIGRMNTTSDWLLWIKPEDRKLVALAVMKLAAGARQVPWMQLRGPMGVKLGAHGLRKRYGRAVTAICNRLNAAENGR